MPIHSPTAKWKIVVDGTRAKRLQDRQQGKAVDAQLQSASVRGARKINMQYMLTVNELRYLSTSATEMPEYIGEMTSDYKLNENQRRAFYLPFPIDPAYSQVS